MTRKHLFNLAFSQLDRPYGWGDIGGQTDCSGFLMDIFSAFGIRLGRHSSDQAKSGNRIVSLSKKTRKERLEAIRSAGMNGVVLLYMPGHIMLYLGEVAGSPYAISAIYETTHSCAGYKDRESILGRTTVTDLNVGKGSMRKSFLMRLTRLSIFGKTAPL